MDSEKTISDNRLTDLPGPPLLLLVDDDPDQLFLFETLLGRANCCVVTASSGKEALEILSSLHVDLVVCDVNMPEISGKELVEKVRKASNLRQLPIIAFSANEISSEQLLECGADFFCPKSQCQALLKQVKEILSGVEVNRGLLEKIRNRFAQ